MSWFAAQKFCHSGGWMMGSVTGAAVEKELVRQWQAKIGQWQQRPQLAATRYRARLNVEIFLTEHVLYRAVLKGGRNGC